MLETTEVASAQNGAPYQFGSSPHAVKLAEICRDIPEGRAIHRFFSLFCSMLRVVETSEYRNKQHERFVVLPLLVEIRKGAEVRCGKYCPTKDIKGYLVGVIRDRYRRAVASRWNEDID